MPHPKTTKHLQISNKRKRTKRSILSFSGKAKRGSKQRTSLAEKGKFTLKSLGLF